MLLLSSLLFATSNAWAVVSVLNFGDSLTLQSSPYLPSYFDSSYDLHSVTVNARYSANGAAKIGSWLLDPDGNVSTPAPATWDVVRFNHGIWDAVPVAGSVASTQEYIANLTSIVNSIRQHSPQAQIIFSTSPVIDPNRVTLDPPPESGLVDYPTYNLRLVDFRAAAMVSLPQLDVIVDDKFSFYQQNDPADFALPAPSHENSGEYWHWDGVHFDESHLGFDASQLAGVIKSVASLALVDLDGDGFATPADYAIFDQFAQTDMSGLTLEESALIGDLDHDRDSDIGDFLLFYKSYDYVNGSGAFAAITQPVPEPSAVLLLCLGASGGLIVHRRFATPQ